MKTKLPLILAALIPCGAGAATIIDSWNFTHPDGTGLNAATSNNGTTLGANSASVSVQGNTLQFAHDSATAGTFRNTTLSSSPSAGLIEVRWDFVAASMLATGAADGEARVGFALRNASNADFAFVRLVFKGASDVFELQYTDATSNNVTAASFAGTRLSDLGVRFLADLDNSGSAGSFQLYYSLGGGPEVAAVTGGTIASGSQLGQFRTAQQITNGGTNWQPGDTIRVDNLVVSTLDRPGRVPDSGSTAVLGACAFLGMAGIRRRLASRR